ncbi:MAG: ABC transporter permease [Caldilineaceae bacterium]|nr:ABC transporter permease [Caldilineaceae bacterium]MBP8109861.1 ABC transporter permease [Caldilineaceae bacterium]MBP8125022.1 ABC transporter permease [Caldilineaceae bacterium]MBP9074771.1 ABC transporter permease [Caldilineaceae bacterium]
MTFFRTLRSAFSSLINNKLRSFLTTLGVIIGVAAVIIMVAVSAGAEAVIAEQINSLGADLIIISASRGTPGAAKTLIYDDAVAIQNEIKGVTGVASEQAPAPQTIKAGSLIFEADVLGTTVDFPSVRDAPVGDGRFFSEDEVDGARKVVVLGSGLAKDLFGDEYAIGQSMSVGTTQFTVIGVMAPKGNVGGIDYDGRVYMPITVVFQKFVTSQLASDKVKTIYAQAESKDTLDNTILQIEALLARRHNVSAEQPDFTVQTQQDIISTQEATTEAFRALLAWVAGVSLLVGGIGIMNIMLVSVTERTQEIGTRQAIGATPADIRRQFLIEALALSLIGGLIGVGAGIGGAWLFGQSGDLRTVVVPSSIVVAFGAALVVGVFFGYFPANKAAQLDPIEALRHE